LVLASAPASSSRAIGAVHQAPAHSARTTTRVRSVDLDLLAKRCLDVAVALVLLVLLAPVMLAVAVAIKLDSPGPVLYRCRRVGKHGREFDMFKFRKMRDGVKGLPLTVAGDARLTRIGSFLTKSKLDEVPQLLNVVRGEMTLVGPRPEDPAIVALRRREFAPVLAVTPGVTGLCQLAYADESSLLDPADRMNQYLNVLLPQKLALDALYAEVRTVGRDISILIWTFLAVALRREVEVDRRTGAPSLKRAELRRALPAHEGTMAMEAVS
jgi:lipopolysaccharide/colanic/teichoic acid biosynthesis glycosyltransferase